MTELAPSGNLAVDCYRTIVVAGGSPDPAEAAMQQLSVRQVLEQAPNADALIGSLGALAAIDTLNAEMRGQWLNTLAALANLDVRPADDQVARVWDVLRLVRESADRGL